MNPKTRETAETGKTAETRETRGTKETAEIRRTLNLLKANKLVEVRSFGKQTLSGYFKDFDRLIAAIQKYPGETFYFVMNDIKDDCYSREQSEKLIARPKSTTADNDITEREWVLIDCDPIRTSGVSATDAEKEAALQTARRVFKYLRNKGFSDPIIADSGNGYHLMYNVALPNSIEYTDPIKNFLLVLAMYFSDNRVDIDKSVFNASRITKLYGTTATKGANTKERPHRQSRILHVPDTIKLNSVELFRKIAAELPQEPKKSYPARTNGNGTQGTQFDIEEFITKYGIRVAKKINSGGITKYLLEECIFNPQHKSPDAAIIVLSNGAIAYNCFHNSCQIYNWQDVRLHFEPDAYDPKQQPQRIIRPQPESVSQTEHRKMQEASPATPVAPKYLKLEDIKERDRSQIISVPSGFHALDKRILGFNKGELTIWSGGNGSGKSTILSQVALEAVNNGFRVAMFSGELTADRVKQWLHLQAAGKLHNKLGEYGRYFVTPHSTGQRIDAWTGERLWIYNNTWGMEAGGILAATQEHIRNYQTDMIIIDNLMTLDLSKFKGDNKYDRQTEIVLRVADMAKKMNIHIHFVCHPRKPLGFLRKEDISGTADITNAADNVIMMHRVNKDFEKNGKVHFGKDADGGEIVDEYMAFSNVMEIMKNRDLGVQDELIGLYFEEESKRMLNQPDECKRYGWEDGLLYEVSSSDVGDDDNPFL